MLPDLTATVRAALDQRLQVARTLAIDPVRAVSAEAGASRAEGLPTTRAVPLAQSPAATEFVARWPAGSTVMARVTNVPEPTLVIADIDGLPLSLEWRGGDGTAPTVGQSLEFRILSTKPEIVLQRLANAAIESPSAQSDAPTKISGDAKMLQAQVMLAAHGAVDERTVRFTTPLIVDARVDTRPVATDATDAVSPHATTATPTAPLAGADALATAVRTAADPALPFAPVMLSGPAWRDQPMDLIVRRQRRDDRFDDPTQDDWCGELVIDLPNIGRVAGHLAWSMQGLRVRLDADRKVSAVALADAVPELAAAFADRHMRVSALSVGHTGLAGDDDA